VDARARLDTFLVVALLASLVLWNVPYGFVALYPFKIFATWLHESSHALAMAVLGVGVDRLEIFRDTSGLAHPAAAASPLAQAIISSAGYMGTAFFGALFLVAGRTERGARFILAGVGLAMAATVVLAVRNVFGVAAVGGFALALLGLARWGSPRLGGFVLQFLAAQSCVNAVLDIRVLYGSTLTVDGQPRAVSDADAVAAVLGGPAALWATLWLLWSFGLFYVALRWLRAPAAPRVASTPGEIVALPPR
jgi:hypothetical protein